MLSSTLLLPRGSSFDLRRAMEVGQQALVLGGFSLFGRFVLALRSSKHVLLMIA